MLMVDNIRARRRTERCACPRAANAVPPLCSRDGSGVATFSTRATPRPPRWRFGATTEALRRHFGDTSEALRRHRRESRGPAGSVEPRLARAQSSADRGRAGPAAWSVSRNAAGHTAVALASSAPEDAGQFWDALTARAGVWGASPGGSGVLTGASDFQRLTASSEICHGTSPSSQSLYAPDAY